MSYMLTGHHHNGDRAARRPDMIYLICGRPFATSWFGARGVADEHIWYPAHVFLFAPYWQIRTISNRLAAISNDNFSTTRFGELGGTWGVGDGPIR